MKYTIDRPFAEPDKAARRLLEHAHAFQPTKMAASISKNSMARSCSATKERRRNTGPASNARFRSAGCTCTKAARL